MAVMKRKLQGFDHPAPSKVGSGVNVYFESKREENDNFRQKDKGHSVGECDPDQDAKVEKVGKTEIDMKIGRKCM